MVQIHWQICLWGSHWATRCSSFLAKVWHYSVRHTNVLLILNSEDRKHRERKTQRENTERENTERENTDRKHRQKTQRENLQTENTDKQYTERENIDRKHRERKHRERKHRERKHRENAEKTQRPATINHTTTTRENAQTENTDKQYTERIDHVVFLVVILTSLDTLFFVRGQRLRAIDITCMGNHGILRVVSSLSPNTWWCTKTAMMTWDVAHFVP